jgi:hypothetical protein
MDERSRVKYDVMQIQGFPKTPTRLGSGDAGRRHDLLAKKTDIRQVNNHIAPRRIFLRTESNHNLRL